MTQNNSTNDDFVRAPTNMKIDKKLVKRMIGETIAETTGVLGVKGGLTDVLKKNDDVTKGIFIHITDDNTISVKVKVITEVGSNMPNIVNTTTEKVTHLLQKTVGLKVKSMDMEVADTMTREAYERSEHSK